MLRRWALERAMFANAHFRGKDEVAFLPEDFLGTGNRQKRQAEQVQERINVVRANQALHRMTGDNAQGLPDWACGEYRGSAGERKRIEMAEERGEELKTGLVTIDA